MKFPNAYNGVKKLFIAEIITVITGLLFVVAGVFGILGLKNDGLLLTAGTLILVSGIALIVAFVFQLVGLVQGGRDSAQIKFALWATLVGIILSVVSSILSRYTDKFAIDLTKTLVDAGVTIAQLFATYYVLLGISGLAKQLGDSAMEQKGIFLGKCVIYLFVASIVLSILATALSKVQAEWLQVTLGLVALAASIINLVVYILTVLYYAKAVKMLKK